MPWRDQLILTAHRLELRELDDARLLDRGRNRVGTGEVWWINANRVWTPGYGNGKVAL